MKYLKSHIVRVLLMALVVLSAATSCYDYHKQELADDSPDVVRYINVTISVSAGLDADTRTPAPQGGEYGDGVVMGSGRENQVNNITLIFYQDASDPTATSTDINTTSDNAKVVCVKKYQVHVPSEDEVPASHSHKDSETPAVQEGEVLYTTGRQRLSETSLEIGKTYKVLVVANTDVAVSVGDKVKDVRDKVAASIYTGTGIGTSASDFVMTSECDATVTLSDPTIDTSAGENRFIYYFDCIHIERLAARIDFWAKGGTYDATYGGYKYFGENESFIVVTAVTPFNLYNESEYLFKRVQDGWNSDAATTYLADETETNYVVDPGTLRKDNSGTYTLSYLSPIAETMSNVYTVSMSNSPTMSADQKSDVGGYDNIIIGYPRENTLMPSSQLKRYATGLAFHTKGYVNAQSQPVERTYYYFLRHQGENEKDSPYSALLWDNLSDQTGSAAVPMNIGIVRNNVYRVSVESVSSVEGTIKLKIEEEKWRNVDHPTIYI